MSKEKLVPKLRFEEFDDSGKWSYKLFENILNSNDGIRRGPFGSALKKELFVKYSNYVVYEQQNAIENHFRTRYYISKEKYKELVRFKVTEGDFILSGAGTIGRISKVPKNIKKGVINQALIRIRIDTEKLYTDFFLQWMRSSKMQKRLTEANPASAMKNLVPMSEIKKWLVSVPPKSEQKKIGSFFKKIDQMIQLQQSKVNKVKNIKSAYLSEMFPKEGEKYPKKRFEGFTEPWREYTLQEIANIRTGYPFNSNDFSETGRYLVVTNGNIQDNLPIVDNRDGNRISLQNSRIINDYVLDIGDILITMDGTVGRTAKVIEKDQILAQRVSRLTANENKEFLYQSLQTGQFYKMMSLIGHGGTIKHISLSDIGSYNIKVPNLQEQMKIGKFFKNLDNQISIEEEKLDKLEKLKQAYLNDMFV